MLAAVVNRPCTVCGYDYDQNFDTLGGGGGEKKPVEISGFRPEDSGRTAVLQSKNAARSAGYVPAGRYAVENRGD